MIEIQNIKLPKIILLVLYTTLMVACLSSIARAEGPATVTITVEGQPLNLLVPPVIVQDRTMVSVRSVTEAVGGTVEWDPVNRRVTITRYEDTVILAVGKNTALVNGKTVALEVAPQIVQDRTMVPLRFIAEALGGTVEWNGETRTVNILRKPTKITGMTYSTDEGKATVTLTLSEPLIQTDPTAAGTNLSLRLYPAQLVLEQPERRIYDSLMKQLKLSAGERTVTLEAQLWYSPSYRLIPSADGRQITLEFAHGLTGFNFRQDGRIPTVTIGTTGKVAYSAFQLDNPPRLVIDVSGAGLVGGAADSIALASPYVQGVRTGDKPEGVRVVLDMAANLPYEIRSADTGLIVTFAPRIQSVKTETLGGKERITFAGNLPMDAKVSLSADRRSLLIDVPQAKSDLAQNQIKLADGTVDTISVAPGLLPNSTLITISLPYYAGHALVTKDGNRSIAVELISSPVYGKRIWIDAGHGKIPGGNDDPGSIGKFFKTYEKVVNLQVSLELQKRLQEAGAIVFMTRTGDEGIDFRDRPARVNALTPPVDLFLSIHHNSGAIATVRGTETYYWTTNPKSKAAAYAIHPALLSGIGFPDRKVRSMDFWVIKETKAPAVLLELGFLSNQDEERAIAEPGVAVKTYPAKAAEAIKNGIFTYFWQEIRAAVAN